MLGGVEVVDVCIVLLYLLCTLAVGFVVGRGVSTMKDFSISDRRFTHVALVATVFASCIGGDDLIGNTERAYSVGIIFLFVSLAQCGNLLCTSTFVIPKILKDFEQKVSIGEIMECLYGKVGRFICGVSNMFFSLGFVAIQVSTIGYVCQSLLNLPYSVGLLIGSFVIIAYSSWGGVRSVIITDVIQFGVLAIGIPLIASVALEKVGGFQHLFSVLPASHLDVSPSNKLFYAYAFLIFSFMFPNFLAVDVQRILVAKNAQMSKNSWIMTTLLYIPFYVILALIGLCAYVLYPSMEDPNTLFFSLLNTTLPPIVKGIAVSGVLAVIMSTADSFLNSAAISAVDDVIPFLCANEIRDKSKLALARIVTVVFGVFAIFVAMGNFEIMIEFMLFFFNFWMPVVSAPMLLYICNYKTNLGTYIVSVCSGLVVLFVYRSLVSDDFAQASQFVGMMATFFSMILFGKFNNKLCKISTIK